MVMRLASIMHISIEPNNLLSIVLATLIPESVVIAVSVDLTSL